MSPPSMYDTPIEVLLEGSELYTYSQGLLEQSRSYSETALSMVEEKPQIMERYRKMCPLDKSSDTEVLSRGVEVMQIVAHTEEGEKVLSPVLTSFKPASIQIDLPVLNQFLKSFNEDYIAEGKKIERFEIFHNHVLPDTLSPKDLEFTSSFSFELKTKVQIIAILSYDNKTVLVRSPTYVNGAPQ